MDGDAAEVREAAARGLELAADAGLERLKAAIVAFGERASPDALRAARQTRDRLRDRAKKERQKAERRLKARAALKGALAEPDPSVAALTQALEAGEVAMRNDPELGELVENARALLPEAHARERSRAKEASLDALETGLTDLALGASASASSSSALASPGGSSSTSACPQSYVCPIMCEMMEDPVIASDGHSYERAAIQQWLETHDTSPLTNLPLEHKFVIANHNLRAAIEEFREREQSRR